jgi:gluconate 5-dehydrogenase
MNGVVPIRGLAPYGASKFGVNGSTKHLALEFAPDVRVNAIAPGFFPTELTQAVFQDQETAAHNAAQTAIGRNGELGDLAGTAIYLASPASDYVTGQLLFVDGGFTAK